jgi:hypothetical protein
MNFFKVPSAELSAESVEDIRNVESEVIISFQQSLESLRQKDFLPRRSYVEKYREDGSYFGIPLVDVDRDTFYDLPGFPVYLLSGSVNFHYGYRRLCAIIKEQIQLEQYNDAVFVFRNKRKDQLLEVRMLSKDTTVLIWYRDYCQNAYRFVDPIWSSKEASIKLLVMEDYTAMLTRMLSSKKAL